MRVIPPAHICFIFFVLVLALGFGGAPVFGDPDTAWHLAAGDLIHRTGAVPDTDPWSFTAAEERWYNLSWLFDVALDALFIKGGFSLLYGLTIIVFSASITAMAHHCIKRGASPVAVFLLVLPVALAIYSCVIARPNMCSVVMTVIFYQLLHRTRETGRLRGLLALPPLMVLWVNLHGGFLLAFVLLGAFLLEALCNKDRKRIRGIELALGACMLATLINPYNLEVYYGAYKTLTTAFAAYINEWKPVEIGHHMPMTLLLLLVLLTGDVSDKRIPVADRVLAITFLLLALSSLRHAAIAALLLMPYLSLRLTTLLHESRMGSFVRKTDATITHDMKQTDIRIMGTAMGLAGLFFISTAFPRDLLIDNTAGFPAKHFPASEAAFIERHYPHGRFFNHYNLGGYLDFLWRGRVKVFVDGRASSVFSEDLLQDYRDFMGTRGFGGRAEMIADHYRLDGVIIPNDDEDASEWHWNPRWKPVYRGQAATVYVRRK